MFGNSAFSEVPYSTLVTVQVQLLFNGSIYNIILYINQKHNFPLYINQKHNFPLYINQQSNVDFNA